MVISARKEAIAKAQEWLARGAVFLDTETTGTGPNDTIVEIAVVQGNGGVLVDTLVRPLGVIPAEAMAIHHITNEMVQGAPRWNEIWPEVETAMAGRPVVIYNADFDLRMLQQTHFRHWMQWSPPTGTSFFCLMKLYAQFRGEWNVQRGNYRWHSLDAAGRQCGIPLPNSHRARADTLLTRELLSFMAKQAS
jgi:DNA polymerase-3 subunit epsilon